MLAEVADVTAAPLHLDRSRCTRCLYSASPQAAAAGLDAVTKAVVTTTIRLRFVFDSTALRPFDDLCYYQLLHCGLNK